MSDDARMPLFRTSPFLDHLGGFSYQPDESGFKVGATVRREHLNAKGSAHGGLIATLADVSLGYVTASSTEPALRMVTSTLSINFVGAAQLDDYLESTVRIVKTGRSTAFADATIAVDTRIVATASASFVVLKG